MCSPGGNTLEMLIVAAEVTGAIILRLVRHYDAPQPTGEAPPTTALLSYPELEH
jgi:hypothetical protein